MTGEGSVGRGTRESVPEEVQLGAEGFDLAQEGHPLGLPESLTDRVERQDPRHLGQLLGGRQERPGGLGRSLIEKSLADERRDGDGSRPEPPSGVGPAERPPATAAQTVWANSSPRRQVGILPWASIPRKTIRSEGPRRSPTPSEEKRAVWSV